MSKEIKENELTNAAGGDRVINDLNTGILSDFANTIGDPAIIEFLGLKKHNMFDVAYNCPMYKPADLPGMHSGELCRYCTYAASVALPVGDEIEALYCMAGL